MANFDKFEKQKSYRFGVLKKSSIGNSITPEFVNNPKSVVVSGQMLETLEIKNMEDYLKRNPHKFPIKSVISCFVLAKDENSVETLQKFGEGNPYPVEESKLTAQTLSDGLPNQIITQQMPDTKSQRALVKSYEDQIAYFNERLMQMEKRNSDLQDKLIDKDREILDTKAEIQKITFERDTYKKILDEIHKDDDKSTLADSVNSIAQNPMVQQGMAMLLGFLQNKFMQQTGQQSFQAPAAGMQDEFDGVSPRPGEFDGSAL